MQIADFKHETEMWLQRNPGGLFQNIPADSGICRIANVAWSGYDPMFISNTPGRWTNGQERYRYFANALPICEAEIGYFTDPVPQDRAVELWKTTREIRAVGISNLPQPLIDALYEDRGAPDVKWAKPHAFIEILRGSEYCDIPFIYAPSASGQVCEIGGTCLIAPRANALECVHSLPYREWKALVRAG